ncbi:DUF2502 domain-containing protein [Pantoea alhagi]|uniref:DUF2502 domain-containing protein n=1 Tax=Pantoea alhagi TaxID=1891675 RepID=UPI00202AF54E|nr:DUF2502 domain-containing protein [Pantoea alhagi]URQ62387.1 DUF2502 domain-containing protein [Pantoea alhagi]
MNIKKLLPGIVLSIVTALPVVASAGVSFDLTPAGVTIHIGDRDHRGYYWDGYDWRAPKWWQEHHGRHIGEKGPRGYWNGNGWQPHRPEAHQQQPVRKKPVTHHQEPARDRPTAHRDASGSDRLAADQHTHGAAGHRPDFQPHG